MYIPNVKGKEERCLLVSKPPRAVGTVVPIPAWLRVAVGISPTDHFPITHVGSSFFESHNEARSLSLQNRSFLFYLREGGGHVPVANHRPSRLTGSLQPSDISILAREVSFLLTTSVYNVGPHIATQWVFY